MYSGRSKMCACYSRSAWCNCFCRRATNGSGALQGGRKEAAERAIYNGIQDCNAATIIGNGSKICQNGCLGLGTCVRSCPFDAIFINDNGLLKLILKSAPVVANA